MDEAKLAGMVSEIAAIVAGRREEFVARLQELLRFETVGGAADAAGQERFGRERQRCLEWLRGQAARLGMAFRDYDSEAAVMEWAGSDPNAPAVGVALHIDVVPEGEGWTHPPFAGEVADGAIWGRGAQDDKGPAAAALAAIEALQEADVRPARSIRLLIGTREETNEWDDVKRLVDAGETPGPVMVPDGAFPIINGEKGMINIEIRAEWAPGASAQAGKKPSKGRAPRLEMVSLRSGERFNVVPNLAELRLTAPDDADGEAFGRLDKASLALMKISPEASVEIEDRMERPPAGPDRAGAKEGASAPVCRFDVRFHGIGAHGAHPDKGHSAALDALRFVALLGGWPAPAQHFVERMAEKAAIFDASGFGLACHHDHLKDTTVNLGVLEMDSGSARAVLNLRFPLGLTRERIVQRFQEMARQWASECPGLQIRADRVGLSFEPLFVSPEEHADFLAPLARAYEATTGRRSNFHSIAGTTYAKAFPLAVAFGPVDESAGEVEMAHQADERVTVERYLENIRIYAVALALLAGEGGQGE